MTAKSIVESTWAKNMGQLLYHLGPNTRKITRRFEKLQLKLKNKQCSIVFNKTCLNNMSSFFSSHFVSVHVVHPYSSIDTTAAWKKLRFILSVRSDFHMIDSLLIAVHAFVSRVSLSFSVDEMLLPR